MAITRTVSLLDCEMEIVRIELKYGRQNNRPVAKSLSSLTLVPKHPNLGIMGMTEILTALSLLGGIVNNTGKNPVTIDFAEVFEQAFGFSFNDIYDRQSDLFKRKPYNLTKTLDAMKAALTKEYRKRKSTGSKETK